MHYPEIRFKYPNLLLNSIHPTIKQTHENDGTLYMLDAEWLQEKVREYREAWSLHGQYIIAELCDILELEFYQNVIDVYVAPFPNSFSDPMFLTAKLTSERAVEVLTHEIVHRLLSDNTLHIDTTMRRTAWRELFGTNHTKITLEHIPVHATLSALYIDKLNEPERVNADRQRMQNYSAYAASWQYVDKVGYKKIIDQLKESYRGLREH